MLIHFNDIPFLLDRTDAEIAIPRVGCFCENHELLEIENKRTFHSKTLVSYRCRV